MSEFTAREHLQQTAIYLGEHQPAAAALRELDRLLSDCMEYVKVRVSDEATKLEERLAQAGYGEK